LVPYEFGMKSLMTQMALLAGLPGLCQSDGMHPPRVDYRRPPYNPIRAS
jgi:hypothetical protein